MTDVGDGRVVWTRGRPAAGSDAVDLLEREPRPFQWKWRALAGESRIDSSSMGSFGSVEAYGSAASRMACSGMRTRPPTL